MTDPSEVILNRPTVVVMAKAAIPGRVKTRLQPYLTPEQAADVHQAMLDCILARLEEAMPQRPRVLAVDDLKRVAVRGGEAHGLQSMGFRGSGGWEVVEQGEGDLGERIERVWRACGGREMVFFGVDCPDVPLEALKAVPEALATHDVAVGAVADGGYWTLAARQVEPALLRDIDWGSPCVYHQTLHAADQAGLSVAALMPWHDVDDEANLIALRQRLMLATDRPLCDLRDRLNAICREL